MPRILLPGVCSERSVHSSGGERSESRTAPSPLSTTSSTHERCSCIGAACTEAPRRPHGPYRGGWRHYGRGRSDYVPRVGGANESIHTRSVYQSREARAGGGLMPLSLCQRHFLCLCTFSTSGSSLAFVFKQRIKANPCQQTNQPEKQK